MRTLFRIGMGLVILGVLVFVGFYIAGGSIIFPTQDTTYELTELYYEADQFDEIIIRMYNKPIDIYPSEDDQIKIVYYESEKNWVEVTEDGLSITFQNEVERIFGIFTWFDWINVSRYTECSLYLPVGTVYSIDAATSNGALSIQDLADLDEVEMTSSNGRITIEQVSVAGDLDLSTSNGRIELTDVTVLGDTTLSTSNGPIAIVNFTGDDLDAHTSNGNIDVEILGLVADYERSMNTSNGSVYLDNAKINEGSFNTSADKVVSLSTSNGTIHLNFSND